MTLLLQSHTVQTIEIVSEAIRAISRKRVRAAVSAQPTTLVRVGREPCERIPERAHVAR